MGKTFRYIDPNLRQSESVSELTFRQRDLWTRLILSVDDQGRCQANPALIRSMVWPLEDIAIKDVKADLNTLAEKKFILLYEVDGKKYLQIINWREYQSQSEWLGASEYPAPEGWEDRYRYHGKGNAIIKSDNWTTFQQGSKLPSPLPSNEPFNDGDGDVKGDGDDDGEGEGNGDGEFARETRKIEPPSVDQAWNTVKGQLADDMNPADYRSSIENVKPCTSQDDTFKISTVNKYAADWITKRAGEVIKRSLAGIYGRPVSLNVIVDANHIQH
jgi:hypothetical protein